MQDKYHALRSIVITLLLALVGVGVTSSEKPGPAEQTLEVIEDCISRSPVPWPEEWKREYIETIRSAVELHRDASHYAVRLEILGNGFAPYWEGITKTKDKSLFEVYRTRIRWCTEHLMGTKFPTGEIRGQAFDLGVPSFRHSFNRLLPCFVSATTALLML